MKGKVVLVPFPFDDLSANKVCPAICFTEPIGPHRHMVLAFVTSVVPPVDPLPTDVIVDPGTSEGSSSGLKRVSALRLHRLMTISTSFVLRELGSLTPPLEAKVSASLRELFSLGAS